MKQWPASAGRPDGRRPHKYHAQRCAHAEHWHDSLVERARCFVLELREAAGQITDLERQPAYPLVVNGVSVGTYCADFCYREGGALVVEDVKSIPTRTPVYRLKRRLVKALYGIDVREVM